MRNHDTSGFQPRNNSSLRANQFPAPRPFETIPPGMEKASSSTNPFPPHPRETWSLPTPPPQILAKTTFPEPATETRSDTEAQSSEAEATQVHDHTDGQAPPVPPIIGGGSWKPLQWDRVQRQSTVGSFNRGWEPKTDAPMSSVVPKDDRPAQPQLDHPRSDQPSQTIQTQSLANAKTLFPSPPPRSRDTWTIPQVRVLAPTPAPPASTADIQPKLESREVDLTWEPTRRYGSNRAIPNQSGAGSHLRPQVQRQVTVGQPNDAYEQEADRVAAQVMAMPDPAPSVQRQSEATGSEEEPTVLQAQPLADTITPLVQRQPEAEEAPEIQPQALEEDQAEIQPKSLAETATPLIQRQEEPDNEEPIQAKCETCEPEEQVQRSTAETTPIPIQTEQPTPAIQRDPNGMPPKTGKTTITKKSATLTASGKTITEAITNLTSQGKGEAGSVTCAPSRSFKTYQADDNADPIVYEADVQVTETKAMPVWTELNQQCEPIKKEWARFYSALNTHEDGHISIDEKAFTNLHTKLLGKKEVDADKIFDDTTTKADTDNATYDTTTQHGITQGTDIKVTQCGGLEKVSENPDQGTAEPAIQTKDDRPNLQPASTGVPQVQPDLENRLSASQSGGTPLPEDVRSFMEPRFGSDFSPVRVHTDGDAVQMNQELRAQAFTHGSHIYYGAGKTPAKDELTGHELTHVVQQTGAARLKPQPMSIHPPIQKQSDENQEAPDQQDPDQQNIGEDAESPLQAKLLSTETQIQRAPGSDPAANVNHEEALLKAVNLVNKNSLLKIKLPVKAPAGHKIFGGLELKKIELELDVVGEAAAPGLSDKKSTTKVSGGVQNVGQSETDPAKRAATEAQGTVWSLELEQKFGSSPFEEMFSFKPGVEYGTYTPQNALSPNKKEFKGKLGFQIAAEGVSLEIQFIPIAYDKAKKGQDAWKFGTFAGKVAKEFVHKAPALLNIGGTKIDVNLKAKLTGSVEIGPDYAKAYQALGKLIGKEAEQGLAQKVAPQIAKEEAELTLKRMVTEMVEDETKDIADAAARKTAREYAERKLMAEVQKRQMEMAAAEQASIFIQRELTEKAGEKLSIFAIRAEAKRIVETLAKPLATELRGALKVMIKEGLEQVGVRSLARNVAKNLVAGPVDFVLVGVQILYNYVDTIVKDMALKELGLRVMACRDNYVAGYTSGLRGEASGGGSAGGGNLEGAAHMLGLKEGSDQFNALIDRHLQDSQVPREEALTALKDVMQGASVNSAPILAKATPKLKEMILSSYEKQFSGGVMRWMFGEDFKASKDYQHFKQYVEEYLQPDKTNTIRTRLKKKGVDKEVYITLVMLDSTGDRAQKFRTEDGKYLVSLSGDTENYSGWVTEDGKPLEEIYFLDQGKADESSSDEKKQELLTEMKQKLSAGILFVNASYNGLGFSFSACKLTNVPSDDIKFQEFMRSPEALGMTVDQAGLSVYVSAVQKFDKEITGLQRDHEVEFDAYGSPHAPVIKVTDSDGYLLAPGWHTEAQSNLKNNLANRRLAALPKLV